LNGRRRNFKKRSRRIEEAYKKENTRAVTERFHDY
jgi:hypothetical protein